MATIGSKEHRLAVGEFFDELVVDVEWLRVPEAYRLVVADDNVDITIQTDCGRSQTK